MNTKLLNPSRSASMRLSKLFSATLLAGSALALSHCGSGDGRDTATVAPVAVEAQNLHGDGAKQPLSTARAHLFKGQDGQFYFNVRARNNEVIVSSEGYKTKQGAEKGLASLERNGASPSNYELRQATDAQWYFVVKARNHEVVGTSETYASKSNARRASLKLQAYVAVGLTK
jgi:uncharacterized protein YegP (UPF0339 family)